MPGPAKWLTNKLLPGVLGLPGLGPGQHNSVMSHAAKATALHQVGQTLSDVQWSYNLAEGFHLLLVDGTLQWLYIRDRGTINSSSSLFMPELLKKIQKEEHKRIRDFQWSWRQAVNTRTSVTELQHKQMMTSWRRRLEGSMELATAHPKPTHLPLRQEQTNVQVHA